MEKHEKCLSSILQTFLKVRRLEAPTSPEEDNPETRECENVWHGFVPIYYFSQIWNLKPEKMTGVIPN